MSVNDSINENSGLPKNCTLDIWPVTSKRLPTPALPHGLAAVVENKRCYFCGSPYHKRSRCPARDVTCHTCQKKGHYARVCMTKDKPLSSRAAALPESFLASVVGAPLSLQAAVLDVEVDKLPARALLVSGATESYIHEDLVKKLKLKSQGELSPISLASVGTSAQVRGFVLASVGSFSHWYELKMGYVRELCADLILGQAFLKRHKSATFLMGGPLKAIDVIQCNTCVELLLPTYNHRVCSSFSIPRFAP